MTLLQKAKEHDFNTVNEFFSYLIESKINGQRTQVRNLYNELDKG